MDTLSCRLYKCGVQSGDILSGQFTLSKKEHIKSKVGQYILYKCKHENVKDNSANNWIGECSIGIYSETKGNSMQQ